MIKKILFSFLFALLLLPGSAAVAQAATGVSELQTNLGAVGQGTGLGKAGDADLKTKVANIINIVLGFLGVMAVIYIIYAGFKWIMAGGNDETIKEAKETIKNAVIGILVVFASYVVVNFAVTQLSRATGGADGGTAGGGAAGQSAVGACTFTGDDNSNGNSGTCSPGRSCRAGVTDSECQNLQGRDYRAGITDKDCSPPAQFVPGGAC